MKIIFTTLPCPSPLSSLMLLGYHIFFFDSYALVCLLVLSSRLFLIFFFFFPSTAPWANSGGARSRNSEVGTQKSKLRSGPSRPSYTPAQRQVVVNQTKSRCFIIPVRCLDENVCVLLQWMIFGYKNDLLIFMNMWGFLCFFNKVLQ